MMVDGKSVTALVEEQLRYCRTLRQTDLLLVLQESATEEECLKKANALILFLKGDVRALNSCANHLVEPAQTVQAAKQATGESASESLYDVETIERLFRRFRQVDTSSRDSCMQAMDTVTQLVMMKERVQAGLSTRLLQLKLEMDKEFGTDFVDMESFLRTENDTLAQSNKEHCSVCTRSFVDLCNKFEVMVHVSRGLRAAKQGLNQTVLLRTLGKERDQLAEMLSAAKGELRRIHHTYREVLTPNLAIGLENRQRNKMEEQHAEIGRLNTEIAGLKAEQARMLVENGRNSDSMAEMETKLASNKDQYERELAWLSPKVLVAENRATEIEGLMDQMNLKLSLLGSTNKKAAEEIKHLQAEIVLLEKNSPAAQLRSFQVERDAWAVKEKKLRDENTRKDRLVTVALAARTEIVEAYRQVTKDKVVLQQRIEVAEKAFEALRAEKDTVERKLAEAEEQLSEVRQGNADLSTELKHTVTRLDMKVQENDILIDRLDAQETQLKDFSNLKTAHANLKEQATSWEDKALANAKKLEVSQPGN
ncbi:unnamed protein product [Choristocarpus tenellus]